MAFAHRQPWPSGLTSREIPFCSRESALTSFCPLCFEVMCNRLPDFLGIIFSIHLQLWSESLWELKVKQFRFWLEDAADFLHELWNRDSKVTPVTLWHSCLLLMPLNWEGNRGMDKPALSCYGQAEASLLCCCSLWSIAFPIWSFSSTQLQNWPVTVCLGDSHLVTILLLPSSHAYNVIPVFKMEVSMCQ